MFYIREFLIRIKFCFLSFAITVFLSYYYKNILLIILSFSLLNCSSEDIFNTFSNFIYTHPAELLKIHFLLIFLISGIFQIPYVFWHFMDFIKSSLLNFEYKILYVFWFFLMLTFLSSNFICFYVLLPNIWLFFQNFHYSKDLTPTLNFFLELRVQEYFTFVFDFLYLVNLFVVFLILLYLLFFIFGVIKLLYWKKLFIFINIVFATLLSPPDVYSQIAILLLLTFLFEFVVFSSLYFFKLKKYLLFNTASY